MSLPRFFIDSPLPDDGEVALPFNESELRHINVRRCEVGEHIACFTEGRQAWEVEITYIDEERVTGRIEGRLPIKKLPHLTLVQGISKGDRMGQTIRQTTELGIERIIPFLAERSIVRLRKDEGGYKGDRWRRIALSAAKQSGRTILPTVEDPTSLEDICEELRDFDRVIIAWEEADLDAQGHALSVTKALEAPCASTGKGCDVNSRVALIIGPEGGLSRHEVESFKALGDHVKVVTLGSLILRTETAGTVATALCMYGLGGLGAQYFGDDTE
ncbi:MAG: RsmE family RNA methyltransferase [Coriobacteriales bacterium]